MPEKTVMIIPAYNEESYIEQAIRSAEQTRRAGIISDYRIVANGCTDGTISKAIKLGLRDKIIILGQRGKGRAIVAGALWAKQAGAAQMVMVDADLDHYKPTMIKELLRYLRLGNTGMTLGSHIEAGVICPFHLTGERAIKLSTLKKLFEGNAHWMKVLNNGFEVDYGLIRLIKSEGYEVRDSYEAQFTTSRHPFRGDEELSARQIKEHDQARKYEYDREKAVLAKTIRRNAAKTAAKTSHNQRQFKA